MMAPSAQRIWPRFTSRSLIAAVTVIAAVVFCATWSQRSSTHKRALRDYETWTGDSFSPEKACAASEAILASSLGLPWSDTEAARREHLARIVSIRERCERDWRQTLESLQQTSEVMCLRQDPTTVVDIYLSRAMKAAR